MNDEIRQPGKWLDGELTQQETAEILAYSDIAEKIRDETDRDVILDAIGPYLNTLMHLLYLMLKGKLDLHTTETGIEFPDGRPMDLVGAVLDFLSSSNENLFLPSISLAKIESLDYPLDKVNRTVWGLLETDTRGQIGIGTEAIGSSKQITILYSINFEDLPPGVSITRKLEAYDKRVYIAAAALFNAGKEIVTYTEIYNAMGYTGRPGAADLEKMDKAISKMGAARIFLDNAQEIAAKYKYDKVKYDGPLLPFERVRAIANGTITESAVRLFREPPLVTFARNRKQITTIPRKLLQSPLNKTDQNMRLEDYLIEEITGVRGKRRNNKFLFETVYAATGINTKKQKQRAPEKIQKLLTHYQSCGFIERFTMAGDGFTVYYAHGGQNSAP